MLRISKYLLALLLIATPSFAQQTLQLGIPANSFTNAATTVANGIAFALPALATQCTWVTAFGSAPASITVLLQTSLDNTTYNTSDTSTSTTGETRNITTSASFIRARISASSGGSGAIVSILCKSGYLGITSPTFTNLTITGTCTGCGGGGTPGGSDTQVQFNDSGSFAGNSGFTFTKGTNTGLLTLSGPGVGSFGGSPALLNLSSDNTNPPQLVLNNGGTFSDVYTNGGGFEIDTDVNGTGSTFEWSTAINAWRFFNPITTGGSGLAVANVGSNSCGTTAATITGNDNAFTIVIGATAGTQCRVTFVTTAPNRRECAANDETTTIAVRSTYVDSTHTDFIGTFTAGDLVSGVCFAR